ncbi:MAG: ATP-binding protein [Bryobacteraceae bacterium]
MIDRRAQRVVADRLRYLPAVAILGPRQSGKTTLAHAVAAGRPSVYLDLESPPDRDKLADPTFYLSAHLDRLVILDEVQRMPELFQVLRGLIDQGRRRGRRTGRYLLLGSASRDLLQQSETLAGRIAYVELGPLDVLEVPPERHQQLWVRGGFPDSFLARSASASLRWRQDFVRTYLERDIPQLGPRIPSATLLRFWTMLAHLQGSLLNAAQLSRSLAVDGKTVARYLDLMVDLMLVRRLQPFQANLGKRLVKSPKVYIRDSGIVHALLNIENRDGLFGHPVVGASWEGFVIENLLAAAPWNTVPSFFRTATGAEIDLVLEIPGRGLWAIEIKRGLQTRPEKGFYVGCEDLRPRRRYVVNAGAERRALDRETEVIGVAELSTILSKP